MATVAIVLNTTKKLTNEQYSIALRVTHKRDRKYYSINSLIINQTYKFRCAISDWKAAEVEDDGFGKFRKHFKDYREYNSILETKLNEAQKLLKKYEAEGLDFDFAQFEADLKHKERPLITSLGEYYTQQITILESQGRVGLAGLYLEVQRIIKKFKANALFINCISFQDYSQTLVRVW